MKDLGYRVKKEREKLGMSMRQFTKYLNVSRPAILNLEDGGGIPRASTVTKIVRKFGWKDGEYADYYNGVSKEEAHTLMKQARDKANRLGLNKRERNKVVGTSQGTWNKWKTEMDPRGKRSLLKFLDMSDEVIRNRVGREFHGPILEEKNPMSGADLKEYRLKHNWSQTKLGSKINTSGTAISKWELGIQTIPASRIRQLYRLFDLPYYEIKRTFKSAEQREKEWKERMEIYGVLDRKTERWSDLPDDDIDLIRLRKVMNI